MPFQTLEVAYQMVKVVKPIIEKIARSDGDLAGQMRRARNSVPLNLAEGSRRSGRDRLFHYRVAAGSCDELLAGVRVAEADEVIDGAEAEPALRMCDRLLGMMWGLTHPKK